MILDATISILAGLGLFFFGVKGLAANMSQLAGRSLRRWLSRSTGSYAAKLLAGILSGALTQSTSAVTVILMSLTSADLIPLAEAKPILAWANVGTAALVFLATLDMDPFVYALVAATGFCFYLNLDRSPRWRPAVSASFALATLLLGLAFVRTGSSELGGLPWLRDILLDVARWPSLGFVAGILLALLVQSSATVTVIAIALISAHLVTFDQATLTVYGASIGSGLTTYLVSAKLRGASRQLAVFQVIIKILGVAARIPLYLVERFFGVPLLLSGVRALSANPGRGIAFVYLACQLAAVAAQAALGRALQPLLERLAPPLPQEGLAKPRYIYPQAIDDPETALTLVDREQARLFALLPVYFGITEALGDEARPLTPAEALASAQTLGRSIDDFLKDLADTGAERSVIEAVGECQARDALLASIHESAASLAEHMARPFDSPALLSLGESLREGLGALLHTAADAASSLDPDDLALLRRLTGDRDSLVDGIRRTVLAADQGLSAADHRQLYSLTSLFELIVWTLRRYITRLAPQAERSPDPIS
ncbi:MAG TPA: Na/Pi symporter [Acetobacteraceae bacterium]|nr:Na/Pi symporter [Acetobacteraceae bacterium]